jgi:pyridoxamine 5'-phosphate oxidase
MAHDMSDTGGPIDDGGIAAKGEDPLALFHAWLAEAKTSEPNNHDAMALASVDRDGRPNVRMVLLKGADAGGFVFFTNYESAKGNELIAQPHAALCFHWKSLNRQVRVRGAIEKTTTEESDTYFSTRAKDSQIGAWASAQSRPMQGRWAFEKEIARVAAQYALSKVPRPPQWGGFRLRPFEIEFWRDRPFRLHDRLVYRRTGPDAAGAFGPWTTARLFP